jgi:hypothetical protein
VWYELCSLALKSKIYAFELLIGCWYIVAVRHKLPVFLTRYLGSARFGQYEKSDIGLMMMLGDRDGGKLEGRESAAVALLGRRLLIQTKIPIGERTFRVEGDWLTSDVTMYPGGVNVREDDLFVITVVPSRP